MKEPLESFAPKCLIEPVEYICYRPSCVGIAYECKHEFAVPEIEAFLDWADKQVVTGSSKFSKALTCLKNRRNDLMTYLEDGHCSLSNNWSENSIRPVTVGRKNWLFSSSVDGAEASMNIYTIIEMAKLHGLNRQKYLEYILEHRPSAEMTDEELSLLAPWNKEVQEACGKCDH